jgi:hypothetical protein
MPQSRTMHMLPRTLTNRLHTLPDNGDAALRGGDKETENENVTDSGCPENHVIDELEDYRAAGEDFRRELTHAVMRDLTSPSGWSVNAEYRSEFGGFFPVQIRFSPAHGHFDVAVCSPGELSPAG